MTQADKVPGPEAPAASLTLTHNHVEPARTTALPAGRRSSSRPGGQSKSLPHRSDAQTSTVVGRGSAGSATATRTARAIAAQRTSGTSWQVSSGGRRRMPWQGWACRTARPLGWRGRPTGRGTVLAAATARPEARSRPAFGPPGRAHRRRRRSRSRPWRRLQDSAAAAPGERGGVDPVLHGRRTRSCRKVPDTPSRAQADYHRRPCRFRVGPIRRVCRGPERPVEADPSRWPEIEEESRDEVPRAVQGRSREAAHPTDG